MVEASICPRTQSTSFLTELSENDIFSPSVTQFVQRASLNHFNYFKYNPTTSEIHRLLKLFPFKVRKFTLVVRTLHPGLFCSH